ncbi:hypothetical protein ACO0K9_17015 [Undibacterium sp. Ji50W]|uniref:hypothetical protein n=1 Tax=Undibacterium sp. Ji50W TaxID=3413041 RepID=UPI003BF0628A
MIKFSLKKLFDFTIFYKYHPNTLVKKTGGFNVIFESTKLKVIMKLSNLYRVATLLACFTATTAHAGDYIYRAILADEVVFETNDYNEASSVNTQGQIPIAWRSVGNIPGTTVPVYRCVIPNRGGQHHFASRDSNCEGQLNEGIYGYVYLTDGPGRFALRRAYSSNNTNHTSSHATWTSMPSSPSAFWDNYSVEFILGYVTENFQP